MSTKIERHNPLKLCMRILKILLIVLLLTSTFGLFACGSSVPPFEDITWVLESYGDLGSLKVSLPNVEVTVFFNSAEKRFTGNAGCNTYFGSYEVERSKLSFPTGVANTQLKCAEDVGKQEEEYLHAFRTARSYQIEDGKLRLNCDQQVIYYLSEPKPQ